MKIIQSLGGPLIGLSREHLHLWSGIDGKRFIGEASPLLHDYEGACHSTGTRDDPPRNIAKIVGVAAEALLITLPYETAVIDQEDRGVYIAQVGYGEPDWNLDQIGGADFDRAHFDPGQDVRFSCPSACTLVFFDAAFPGAEIGDASLAVDLDAGDYTFSTAPYEPDEKTGLILHKLTRVALL